MNMRGPRGKLAATRTLALTLLVSVGLCHGSAWAWLSMGKWRGGGVTFVKGGWFVTSWSRFGARRWEFVATRPEDLASAPAHEELRANSLPSFPFPSGAARIRKYQAGWPILLLECDGFRDSARITDPAMHWRAAIELRPERGATWEIVLPYRPIWCNYLLTIAVITIILYAIRGIVFAGLAIRRRLRLARHCCPFCAYPSHQVCRCPECGRANGQE